MMQNTAILSDHSTFSSNYSDAPVIANYRNLLQ